MEPHTLCQYQGTSCFKIFQKYSNAIETRTMRRQLRRTSSSCERLRALQIIPLRLLPLFFALPARRRPEIVVSSSLRRDLTLSSRRAIFRFSLARRRRAAAIGEINERNI